MVVAVRRLRLMLVALVALSGAVLVAPAPSSRASARIVDLGPAARYPAGSVALFSVAEDGSGLVEAPARSQTAVWNGKLDGCPPDPVVGIPFALVRLTDGSLIALSTISTHGRALVPWVSDYERFGRAGWFVEPCLLDTYDVDGTRVYGPAARNLDRYAVEVRDGRVLVDLGAMTRGEAIPGRSRYGGTTYGPVAEYPTATPQAAATASPEAALPDSGATKPVDYWSLTPSGQQALRRAHPGAFLARLAAQPGMVLHVRETVTEATPGVRTTYDSFARIDGDRVVAVLVRRLDAVGRVIDEQIQVARNTRLPDGHVITTHPLPTITGLLPAIAPEFARTMFAMHETGSAAQPVRTLFLESPPSAKFRRELDIDASSHVVVGYRTFRVDRGQRVLLTSRTTEFEWVPARNAPAELPATHSMGG